MSTAADQQPRIVPCASCGVAMEEYSASMHLCRACLRALAVRLAGEAEEGADMIVLTQQQLTTCWFASTDAHRDNYDGGTHAREARLAIIPAADHDPYRHAYQTAYAAITEGHGIHVACTAAEDALREWAVAAGVG